MRSSLWSHKRLYNFLMRTVNRLWCVCVWEFFIAITLRCLYCETLCRFCFIGKLLLKSFQQRSLMSFSLCFVSMEAGAGNRRLCARGTAAHRTHSSAYSGTQVSFSSIHSPTSSHSLLPLPCLCHVYLSLTLHINLYVTHQINYELFLLCQGSLVFLTCHYFRNTYIWELIWVIEKSLYKCNEDYNAEIKIK